jgi:hypothetical protein
MGGQVKDRITNFFKQSGKLMLIYLNQVKSVVLQHYEHTPSSILKG